VPTVPIRYVTNRVCSGLMLFVGCNYLRSYYLHSCTRVGIRLLPGIITRRYVRSRNVGNCRGFYSRKGKSHKKSRFAVGTALALPLIDGRLS